MSSYEARVTGQRIEGEPPERYFRCTVEVVDTETGDVEASKPLGWRMAGPKVEQASVQRWVDRQKQEMLTDVENTAGFDPDAIT